MSTETVCITKVHIFDRGDPGDPSPVAIKDVTGQIISRAGHLRVTLGDETAWVYTDTRERFVEIVRSLYADLGTILQSEDDDTPAPGFIAGGHPVEAGHVEH